MRNVLRWFWGKVGGHAVWDATKLLLSALGGCVLTTVGNVLYTWWTGHSEIIAPLLIGAGMGAILVVGVVIVALIQKRKPPLLPTGGAAVSTQSSVVSTLANLIQNSRALRAKLQEIRRRWPQNSDVWKWPLWRFQWGVGVGEKIVPEDVREGMRWLDDGLQPHLSAIRDFYKSRGSTERLERFMLVGWLAGNLHSNAVQYEDCLDLMELQERAMMEDLWNAYGIKPPV